MRRTFLFALALAALLPAAPARTRAAEGAPRDTSGFLPHWLEASAEAGVGWMASPARVNDRYTAGLDAALELQALLSRSARIGARAEYHDLPSSNQGFVATSGGLFNEWDTFGDGRALMFLGTASVRALGALWLDGAAGAGHFASGLDGIVFVDGVTGENFAPPGVSGWGTAFGAGLRYEFQPTRRDRMFAGAYWRQLERAGETLQFGAIRVGYRFR